MFLVLEPGAGTAASAHSSSEAAAAKTSASSETSTSSEATDKRTASAATPMVIIIVITLVATHECMSAVPARISNIFGLHSVVAILVIWAVSVYNGLVTMDENVTGQWANVETQYQRRADLIPNLVNTVKGYATHEKETLEGVVAARSQATQIKVDAEDLTPEKLAEYQKAQGAVTSALGKLLAITENYPDLKANQNFLELQAQLEGTENRINVARKNFNDAAQAYNTNIRRFPKNIFAGMFGFDKKAYFEAEEGSEKAPKVEF